ncbi:MAG: 50S ribosomal protein L5 [Nanoarchaeota archaeon]
MEKSNQIMKQIRIEKINLNIGVGAPGENLEKAVRLLQKIAQIKPVKTKSKRRIPTWGLRPNLEIGANVTVRGRKAEELLKRLLMAVKNTIKKSSFDNEGNVSFGIPEYLNIHGVEYDSSIGIIGLEAAVTLQRPGFRIKRRRLQQRRIPRRHRIAKEEAVDFIKQKFNTTIIGA